MRRTPIAPPIYTPSAMVLAAAFRRLAVRRERLLALLSAARVALGQVAETRGHGGDVRRVPLGVGLPVHGGVGVHGRACRVRGYR